jgi:hypothetical protein
MNQAALKLTNEETQFSLLLTKLEDETFVSKFAVDPHTALEEAGVEMNLAEFTSKLSEDKEFYQLVTKKLSKVVDVTALSVPVSSCCN